MTVVVAITARTNGKYIFSVACRCRLRYFQISEQAVCSDRNRPDGKEGIWFACWCGLTEVSNIQSCSFIWSPTLHCRDTFIYEYVGDVVSQPSFLKRMRQYAEEGIRHFYFMMLQKDEVRSVPTYLLYFPLTVFISSLTPQSAAALVGSPITAATRTAMWQGGLSVPACEWVSLPVGVSKRMRS